MNQWHWCIEEKDEDDNWQIGDKGQFFAADFGQAIKQFSCFVDQPFGVDWELIDKSFSPTQNDWKKIVQNSQETMYEYHHNNQWGGELRLTLAEQHSVMADVNDRLVMNLDAMLKSLDSIAVSLDLFPEFPLGARSSLNQLRTLFHNKRDELKSPQ